MPKGLGLPLTIAVLLFFTLNLTLDGILPDGFFGIILHIPLFIAGFLAGLFGILILFKDRFIGLLLRSQSRFLVRSKALSAFATRAGFTYVPAPGGAPPSLKALANWKRAPKELHDAVEMLEAHGGMDGALEAARLAGVMAAPATVIGGTPEQRAVYADQATSGRLEDGFLGEREGVTFAAFEWIESVDEAPDIHHLVVVLTAPLRLQSVTQLRTRSTSWPRNVGKADLEEVDLGPQVFSRRFKLRSNDQTEARAIFNPAVIERVAELAHGDKIKATAFGQHLVIDLEGGGDRFNLLDLVTGEWSEESVRTAIGDILELSDFVGEAAHAFMVRSARR